MNFYIMLSALTDDDRKFAEKIYTDYGKYMYAVAFDILKNRQDAEDSVNDAMCKIIKYLSKFEGSADAKICNMVIVCIRSIVKNKAIDNYNKNKKRARNQVDLYIRNEENGSYEICEIGDESFATEDIVIKKEECEVVRCALLNLSEDLQDAVNLVYFCGYSGAEAADYLGISSGALRARLYKARKKLKEILSKEFGGKW